MGKFLVQGDEIAAPFAQLDVDPLPQVGRFMNVLNGVLAPCHLYRLRTDQVLVLAPLERREAVEAALQRMLSAGGCAHFLDVSSGFASLLLAGHQALPGPGKTPFDRSGCGGAGLLCVHGHGWTTGDPGVPSARVPPVDQAG